MTKLEMNSNALPLTLQLHEPERLPHHVASDVFNSYAALDTPALPTGYFPALQVELARWQSRNFGGATNYQMLAGVTEEVGELAHAILKHEQRIRGMDDMQAFRAAAGDAVADATVYLIQLCTLLRLDFATLVQKTAEQVMKREWTKNRATGGAA